MRLLVSSPEFEKVFNVTANSGFAVLYSRIEKLIAGQDKSGNQPPKMHLASIVLKNMKELQEIFNAKIDNEYLLQIQWNKQFNKFCALIYSMGIEF